MAGLSDLRREYERAHFPASRRLDIHGEGPSAARDRALHWIQSRAHEEPGGEFLLIVERAIRPGRPPSVVAQAVVALLQELQGKLLEWWQPFTPGTYAIRIAETPSMLPAPRPTTPGTEGEGRTADTAGAARPSPRDDIPPELLALATQVAELRMEREALSPRVGDVVLREIWIEAQALAMDRRITFEAALEILRLDETHRVVRD